MGGVVISSIVGMDTCNACFSRGKWRGWPQGINPRGRPAYGTLVPADRVANRADKLGEYFSTTYRTILRKHEQCHDCTNGNLLTPRLLPMACLVCRYALSLSLVYALYNSTLRSRS
jgi:hypothetical protein